MTTQSANNQWRKALAALTARFDVADRRDHDANTPLFNRSVSLHDTWAQKAG